MEGIHGGSARQASREMSRLFEKAHVALPLPTSECHLQNTCAHLLEVIPGLILEIFKGGRGARTNPEPFYARGFYARSLLRLLLALPASPQAKLSLRQWKSKDGRLGSDGKARTSSRLFFPHPLIGSAGL